MNISIATGTTNVDYAIVSFEHGYYSFGAAYTQCGFYQKCITLYDVSELHSEIRVLIEKAKRFHAKSTISMNVEGKKCRVIENGFIDAYSKKMSEFSDKFNQLVSEITVQYNKQVADAASQDKFSKAFFFKVSIG